MIVQISTPAELDFAAALGWLGERNVNRASRFLIEWDALVARLEMFPDLGHQRADLDQAYLAIEVEGYIALYRRDSDRIRVMRIVNAASDLFAVELG